MRFVRETHSIEIQQVDPLGSGKSILILIIARESLAKKVGCIAFFSIHSVKKIFDLQSILALKSYKSHDLLIVHI